MATSATSKNGKAINVGDLVSVGGFVVSYTGTGGTAQVTIAVNWQSASFVAQANDCQAANQFSDSSHQCTSISGAYFGAAGDPVTALGKVTAISGSNGPGASLTITLTNSGLSVTVPAGAVNSDNV